MGSHTATGEWQSFEMRMRRRRAERLLVRAEVAAEAGFGDEARDCLEEARRLAPGLAAPAALWQQIERPVPDTSGPVAFTSLPRKILPFAMAGAALLAILIARWPHPIVPAVDGRALLLPAPPARPFGTVEAASFVESRRAGTETAAPMEPAATAQLTPVDQLPARASRDSGETPDDFVAPLPPAPVEHPETRVPEPASPMPVAYGLASNPPGAPIAVSAPVPTAAGPSSDTDATVRRVLDRYAAAYSALDAAAAERVWPSVNRGALTRAFDALASQEVSLGNCRIDVRAAAALADCTGSTTWTPKVGDRSPRTEERRWTFELARAGDAWQIVNARVQNR